MRKVISMFSLIFSLAMVLVLFGIHGSASASDYYEGWFTTEDGAWDGEITVSSSLDLVRVGVRDTESISSVGYVDDLYGDTSMLRVRLCSVSSGNCTSYKSFTSDHLADFTNMKTGTYHVDIIDTWSSYHIRGYATVSAE